MVKSSIATRSTWLCTMVRQRMSSSTMFGDDGLVVGLSQPLEHIPARSCSRWFRDRRAHDRTSDGRGFTVELAGRGLVRGEAAGEVIAGVVLLAVDQLAYVGEHR